MATDLTSSGSSSPFIDNKEIWVIQSNHNCWHEGHRKQCEAHERNKMETKIAQLTNTELRVYAEIAYASNNGICNTPATVIRHRCNLSIYLYSKALASLEKKEVIAQEIRCGGVPRIIRLTGNNYK